MKTAGQLFLEWYNNYVKDYGCAPSDYDVNFYWTGGNLEKEKQQIIDANTVGFEDVDAEQYYNETYNTK